MTTTGAKPEPESSRGDANQYEGHDLEALFDLDNYQRWICECFFPYVDGHSVEFGAGIGAISRRLRDRVQRLDLVEPSTNLLPQLKARFADDPGVEVFADTVATYSSKCELSSRDSVVLINVLEHIEDDRGAMGELARIVRPGGHALIFVPALPALYSRLDSRVGHFRRYTRSTLAAAVQSPAWRIVALRYFDLLGVAPWWLINTIGGKRSFDPRMARLYDRLFVPVTRAIESAFPPPLGKNLLLIAERRA